MDNLELKAELLKLADIRPYRMNAKEHPPEQIAQIVESIKEFGFDDPIAVWGEDNTIVEGHGRYLAAQALGLEEVPVIRLDHLTDEERRAYTLIHNQLTMNTGFDHAILDIELDSISNIDLSIHGFHVGGIDPDEIDGLFDSQGEKQEREPKRIQCPKCGEWFEI